MFRGVLIDKTEGRHRVSVRRLDEADLPDGDVTVRVRYSTLNYKDALAITGNAPVVRKFPMVPGIDFAGIVTESRHADYEPGTPVLINGWGIGEARWGGLAELARVSGEWLLPLPSPFTLRQSMALGTAGYTAMLCVLALERHAVTPSQGPVIVTGASGGVGSVAVSLLSKLGYEVAAVTGRPELGAYLRSLGASVIIGRSELDVPCKPLEKERWAGAIDVAGGRVLAHVCAATKYRGAVAACGLASDMQFPATVAPFILRGVTLVGVDSVMAPRSERLEAWSRLARDIDLEKLDSLSNEVPLERAIDLASHILEGKIRGRTVVAVQDL